MSSVTIGNATLTQNHPRIISVVSNNAEVYQANTGGLKMFTALISERGEETTQTLSHQSELIKGYGNLDIKKYGQAAYNVQNWLQAGGQAVVRRVMPDDATFAHAFINIRSKKVGNEVYIQPIVSSIGGASTKDILAHNLESAGGVNYDGYNDHLILELTPVGRGKSYNSLGFRLYTNKQYDNFLNYRLYNFDVVEFGKNGSIEIVEGPFAVSLYRDALSPINDESIFIEDVLARYSNMVSAKVNDEELLALCQLINPDASNPYIVDPLFAETRIINGKEETIGNKDVHDTLIKKNEDGTVITNTDGSVAKRIYSVSNEFDTYRIELEDQAIRDEYSYLTAERPTEMLEFLAKIKNESSEVGYGADLTADLSTISTNSKKVISESRKLISRCMVGGHNYSTLQTELTKYINAKLVNDLKTELKSRGTVTLNDFQTLYTSDLKLIANSTFESKVAFIQAKITEYYSILCDLGVDLETVTDCATMLGILNTLSDKYVLTSAKQTLVATALNPDVSHSGSLGKLINDIKTKVIQKLGEGVKSQLEVASEFNNAYKAAHGASATDDDAVATKNYDEAIIKVLANKPLFCSLVDFKNTVRFRDGSDGCFDENHPNRKEEIEKYLVNLYNGNIDPLVTSTKLTKFNFVIDANYSDNVKNAIVNLATNIRRDFIFIADCGLNANAKGDLEFRQKFNTSTNYVAIYGQTEVIYDATSGKDIKVTTPYLMASKLPVLETTTGLQNPIAGSKRGLVDGFKAISYLPTELEQEDLYNARVNYIVGDGKKYMLGSQLTADYKRTPLSDLNNVITMLNVKRDSEEIVSAYQFEFVDNDVMRSMQQDLNLNLNKYVSGRAADSISCSVYASEYDALQHIVRVNVSIKFKDIIETVIITLEVTR